MEKYLYIYPSVSIVEYESDKRKLFVLYSSEESINEQIAGRKQYSINPLALEIILQFDGTKTLYNIIEYFMKKYSEPYEKIEKTILVFMEKLTVLYGFKVIEQHEPRLHNIEIKTYKSIYPTVVSIELTDRCNYMCRHCYGSYQKKNTHEIPKDKLKNLFLSLKEIGVLTVELTGGDVSIYPFISEAIEAAINSGVSSVMVLTNGAVLSDNLINTLIKYKENIFVQIDLHSLNEKYYDWFTGTKGLLPRVKDNIKKLIKEGIKVRICSIITPLNISEFKELVEWSNNHNAIAFAPSAVVELGRAHLNKELLFVEENQLREFNRIYKEMFALYPNFIKGITNEEKWKREQCGALISQCSIMATGEVKMCTMDTGSYFNLKLGNVLMKSMKDIFDSNSKFLYEFSKMKLPRIDSVECKDCIYIPYCHGCYVRGFLMAKKQKENCKWYVNNVSTIVKERFPIMEMVEGGV